MLSIGTLAAVSILFFATNSVKNNHSLERSHQAQGLASACAELGVQNVIATPAYTGTVNAIIADGSCVYVVTKPTPATILITATGTVRAVVRKVSVTLNLSPMTITSWQEIP